MYINLWNLYASRLLYILFCNGLSLSFPKYIKHYKLGKSIVTRNIEGLCTLYNRHVIYFTQLEWRFNSFLRSLRNWNHRVSVESFQHTRYTTLLMQNITELRTLRVSRSAHYTIYLFMQYTVLSPLSYASLVYKWRTKNLRARETAPSLCML